MPLSREQTFDLWAPASSPWSPWVKPVLFAYLPEPAPTQLSAAPTIPLNVAAWAPAADGSCSVLIDLPGVLSVRLAEALVLQGYRPVPLFNAVPFPLRGADSGAMLPLVDVDSIADALQAASARLAEHLRALPPEAPPAFLLDANRRSGRPPEPGAFDNRSLSLPTDFPSAAFLQSRGIARALLALDSAHALASDGQPEADLAHTLLRWQEAGIRIESCAIDSDLELHSPPHRITVERPRWYRAIWHNALSVLGLRRNPLGGFGGELPIPSRSSGAGG
ncbi:MAG TPA: hypothetical protein VFK05_38790 [Polyangiaceae bacterium]|nr:hypothetical protein [Polyangiaceae bacterium]